MKPLLLRSPWFMCLAGVAGGSVAQPLPAAPPVAPTQAASAALAATATAAPQASGLRVIEDDNVRIEETRVRGQLRRIVVHDKTGDKPRSYEILVGSGGRDPSQDKSAAGQRVWSVLRF